MLAAVCSVLCQDDPALSASIMLMSELWEDQSITDSVPSIVRFSIQICFYCGVFGIIVRL